MQHRQTIYEADNPGVWVDEQCRALGISLAAFARQAKVDWTGIWRWKHNLREPMFRSLKRAQRASDELWAMRAEAKRELLQDQSA